ncbi:MAG: type II toxin-antitoxin system VapC family toxin [Acidobacteria bacterium]|nr:type II toxin-antitoxin system VapC family toxin [Acidobacteriota bacterium]
MALSLLHERLVLDTSAYSRLCSGHDAVLDTVSAAGVTLIPATVLGELEAGFSLGSRPRENRLRLAEFLAEPFVRAIDTTAATARHYGALFAHLRSAGTPVPINDVWIAAATLERGGHLLTFDSHFSLMAELSCTVLEA